MSGSRNPHVVLTLRMPNSQTYMVTWRSATQLIQMGVTAQTFHVGDRVTVTGSPAKDAAHREITLIREVQWADGWVWRMEDGRVSVTAGRPLL